MFHILDSESPEALALVFIDNLIKGVITNQDGSGPPGSMGEALLALPAAANGSPGGLTLFVPSLTSIL